MGGIEEFRNAVDRFNRDFRGPKVETLRPSDPYDIDHDHPRQWPDATKPGIYAFFDKDRNLLYVGKASLGNAIGNRIGAHLSSNPKRPWMRLDDKSKDAQFIVTVATAADQAFVAAALEEFLIREFKPPRNTLAGP